MQRHTFTAFSSTQAFTVDSEYEFVKELGQGASGSVIAMRHKKSGKECAIKRISSIGSEFESESTKQCLREIKLLHCFKGHKNIICLYDLDIVISPNGGFNEVYIYQELMGADLHAVIQSGQPLTDAHFQSLVYQILCGLKYIHSANVLHRDITPSNLLVNTDCELKICDFGHAIEYKNSDGTVNSTEYKSFRSGYLAMRWYRAPETLTGLTKFTTAIDLWSLGCILAEFLGGKPLFKGRDHADQLNQIVHCLGVPSMDVLRRICSPRVQQYILSLPSEPRESFSTLYPNANPLAIDLLSKMLCFDPEERISCEEALSHPYLQDWHDPDDEPSCKTRFDFSFEQEDSILGLEMSIAEEVNSFREEVRAQAKAGERTGGEDRLPTPTPDEITNSPIPAPQGPMTQIQPVSTSANVLPDDSLQGVTPRAHSPNGVLSEAANPRFESPIRDTLSNDLTGQITQDGNGPVACGGFADIYRGILQINGQPVKVAIKAIKSYSDDESEFSKKRKRIRREIKVWLNLKHVNVLPLLGTTTGFGCFPSMVCPWVENGTLTNYLECRYDRLSVAEILILLNDVACGLQYLHSCSIVHGDLSGSNVLIRGDGRACIADFGLSMLLTELGGSTFVTSFQARGTLRWTAPELLDLDVPEDGMDDESPHVTPTTQSDVYSFGSIMIQILSGKVPYHYFSREAQVLNAVSKGMTPRRLSSVMVTDDRWMVTVMQRCWSITDISRSRPLSEEIVQFTGRELANAYADTL